MNQTETKKPSWALLVALLLLVFSLIGNMFLLAKNIQYKQDDKIRAGKEIYNTMAFNKDFFEGAVVQFAELEKLMEQDELSARIVAGVIAAEVKHNEQQVKRFMSLASEYAVDKFAQAEDKAAAYMNSIQVQLLEMSKQEEKLNEQDRKQLLAMKQSSEQMIELFSNFYFEVEDNSSVMLRLAGGFEWLDIAGAFQQELDAYSK